MLVQHSRTTGGVSGEGSASLDRSGGSPQLACSQLQSLGFARPVHLCYKVSKCSYRPVRIASKPELHSFCRINILIAPSGLP